jgi:hypothetical protein
MRQACVLLEAGTKSITLHFMDANNNCSVYKTWDNNAVLSLFGCTAP